MSFSQYLTLAQRQVRVTGHIVNQQLEGRVRVEDYGYLDFQAGRLVRAELSQGQIRESYQNQVFSWYLKDRLMDQIPADQFGRLNGVGLTSKDRLVSWRKGYALSVTNCLEDCPITDQGYFQGRQEVLHHLFGLADVAIIPSRHRYQPQPKVYVWSNHHVHQVKVRPNSLAYVLSNSQRPSLPADLQAGQIYLEDLLIAQLDLAKLSLQVITIPVGAQHHQTVSSSFLTYQLLVELLSSLQLANPLYLRPLVEMAEQMKQATRQRHFSLGFQPAGEVDIFFA